MKKLFLLIALFTIPINATNDTGNNYSTKTIVCVSFALLVSFSCGYYKYFKTPTAEAITSANLNVGLASVNPKKEESEQKKPEINDLPKYTIDPIDQQINDIAKQIVNITNDYTEHIKEKIKQVEKPYNKPKDMLTKMFTKNENIDILYGY